MRVVIYARVSTDDGRQDVENQLRELRDYANRMGWQLVGEYCDHMSGRKSSRPEFERMMNGARRRRFDLLLFWSLDRVSREGAYQVLRTLNELASFGVKYRSLQEQWIDSLGAFGDAIVGLLATIAKFEAERISERVRAGLKRAKAHGTQLGRPRVVLDRHRIARMRTEGCSLRQIAEALNTSTMTIQRLLKTV